MADTPAPVGCMNMWITGPAINVTLSTPSGERIGMYVSDPDTKALLEDARRKLDDAQAQIRSLEDKLQRYSAGSV